MQNQHTQVGLIKVTGTHVFHVIVTNLCSPCQFLHCVGHSRCWTRTYSDPPFLHKRTSYRSVATWCIVPTQKNSHILTQTFQNCTFSFWMQLCRRHEGWVSGQVIHHTPASGQWTQGKWRSMKSVVTTSLAVRNSLPSPPNIALALDTWF